MIEVILTQHIKKIGQKNSVVKVKDGYGNYLIAQGLARLGTISNKKNLAEVLRQSEQKNKQIRLEQEKLGEKIDAIQLIFLEKVDEGGKLFGTITPLKIAQAYKMQHNIVIDPKQITIVNAPIKELGTHKATLSLHEDLQKNIQFQVKSTS